MGRFDFIFKKSLYYIRTSRALERCIIADDVP